MKKTLSDEIEKNNDSQSQVINKNQQHQRILLVEDNKINQLIATRLLESLGLTVDVAQDGYEAIAAVNENEYLVVLMDIQMPKMGGVEATIELRKTYSPEQLIIIALTANVTSAEIDYYMSIGMNRHLGKPYEIVKIKEVLMNYYHC